MNTTSTNRRVNRHLAKMDREFALDHDTSKYRSLTNIWERENQLVIGLAECFATIHPMDRKRLLNYVNIGVTDSRFLKCLRLALQS